MLEKLVWDIVLNYVGRNKKKVKKAKEMASKEMNTILFAEYHKTKISCGRYT
jgi:hypothetical protein